MESYNNQLNVGYKFSLEDFDDNRLVYKINADQIIWDSILGQWKLKNYFIRKTSADKETLVKGTVMDTLININPRDFSVIVGDIKTMNYSELRAYIEKEQLKGTSTIKDYLVEKHKRIAFPFATIILTLIGVSISSRKVRGGIGVHLGLGIAITFTFIFFLQITTVFATHGNLEPWLAVWIPNMIFGVVGIFLLRAALK
jgi:lipopolysaccharide export system permease protein